MDLLECSARELFCDAGIPVQTGFTISEVSQIEKQSEITFPVVVKAQVLTGGRGKAGGIRFAENMDELKVAAGAILGMDIRGHIAEKVMIVEKAEIRCELYLSIILDRNIKKHVIIFSPRGGMDIEQTAKENPEQIIKIEIDPLTGFLESDGHLLAAKAELSGAQTKQLVSLIQKLYALCLSHGCMLAEINPLAVDLNGNLLALDAKVTIDDSAVARNPAIAAIRDAMPKAELIKEAEQYKFLYIPCDIAGSVVVMSNGSGMLMSCIDHITKKGMTVLAVLDLGGGATADRIRHAVRILYATLGAQIMFINIFGGITRCDEVAAGIRDAVTQDGINQPIIVRIEGTNREKGAEILSQIPSVQMVDGLKDGVKAIVGCKNK